VTTIILRLQIQQAVLSLLRGVIGVTGVVVMMSGVS